MMHYTDIDNHAFIYFDTDDDTLNFTRIVGGAESNTLVGTASEDLTNQIWYTLRVEHTGSGNEYFIELSRRDSSPIGTATELFNGTRTDTTFTGAQAGFGYNFAGAGYTDNFKAGNLE